MHRAILLGLLATMLGATGCEHGGSESAGAPAAPEFESETSESSFLGTEGLPPAEGEFLAGVGEVDEIEPEAGVPDEDSVDEDAPSAEDPNGVHLDLTYPALDGQEHPARRLDLYGVLPAQSSRPVMIYVHGGAWRVGDKSRVHSKAKFFVEQGYLFVSVNYRLSPDVQHPAHAEDVAAAVAWVFDHAPEYGGDAGRISLMGHSAGAHLVALTAAAPHYLQAHGRSPSELAGVLLLDGAGYNIPRLRDLNPRQFERTYAPAFGEDPETLREASPITHVAGGMAPHLVLHVDRRMGRLQSEEYAAALEGAGVSTTLEEIEGKDHRGINVDLGRPAEPMNDIVLDFLGNH